MLFTFSLGKAKTSTILALKSYFYFCQQGCSIASTAPLGQGKSTSFLRPFQGYPFEKTIWEALTECDEPFLILKMDNSEPKPSLERNGHHKALIAPDTPHEMSWEPLLSLVQPITDRFSHWLTMTTSSAAHQGGIRKYATSVTRNKNSY